MQPTKRWKATPKETVWARRQQAAFAGATGRRSPPNRHHHVQNSNAHLWRPLGRRHRKVATRSSQAQSHAAGVKTKPPSRWGLLAASAAVQTRPTRSYNNFMHNTRKQFPKIVPQRVKIGKNRRNDYLGRSSRQPADCFCRSGPVSRQLPGAEAHIFTGFEYNFRKLRVCAMRGVSVWAALATVAAVIGAQSSLAETPNVGR